LLPFLGCFNNMPSRATQLPWQQEMLTAHAQNLDMHCMGAAARMPHCGFAKVWLLEGGVAKGFHRLVADAEVLRVQHRLQARIWSLDCGKQIPALWQMMLK